MSEEKRVNTPSKELLDNAISETIKKTPRCSRQVGERTIRMIANKWLDNKLHDFPKLCSETRRINWLKQKDLREIGSDGWSKKKDFKFDYTIPSELYMFMINMVYTEFWKEENEKVWRSFMQAIMRGDDAMILLRKVRMHYEGANQKVKFR